MSPKKQAAEYAFESVKNLLDKNFVLGIGTGSTTNYFIELLKEKKPEIKCFVSSSVASTELLKDAGYLEAELNDVGGPDLYIDGADEVNSKLELIKGGGGALTREKILAYSSDIFICIVDESKYTDLLGKFPLPIEVIEIARSAISRELMKMGGKPIFRNGFISDNGNQIIDIHNLPIDIPYDLEAKLNNVPGVVENGIFANRKADVIICSTDSSIEIIQ